MNNEIKKILKIEVDCDYKKLSVDEISILEDYITNLQEENKRLIELDENYPIEEQLEEALKYENIYKSRIEKVVEYIKQNCILSDEWKDLDVCNFVPIGKITYKQLNKKGIKQLLDILNGGKDE